MNNCLVLDKGQIRSTLIAAIEATRTNKDNLLQAKNRIKKSIEDMIGEDPIESQSLLIKTMVQDLYKSPSPYGKFVRLLFQPNDIELIFNPNKDKSLESPLSFEEASRKRERNFIASKFKEAPNAKLYFKRSIKNDMVDAFLVRRDEAAFHTTQEDMNLSVKTYKQQLLDRVLAYFNSDEYLKEHLEPGITQMYDKDGNYTFAVEKLKKGINRYLDPKFIEGHVLEKHYSNYRDSINDPETRIQSQLFLDAYNAWITLQDFDTIVDETMGSIIRVTSNQHRNKHTGTLSKYEIKNRASNMWVSWTASDDINDMADIISDVCQNLVETSRLYQWGNQQAFSDRYLTFNDFNFGIGLIKRWVDNPQSKNIDLSTLKWTNKEGRGSIYTQRVLLDIMHWNRVNGNFIKNSDGSLSNIPKPATLYSLISRMNENPQRYLHAIFDIICNTNLIKSFSLNDYAKNVLWSLNKEIFGGSTLEPRSLYRMHTLAPKDNIYQILTQVAASTFPEDYMQYYENYDGNICTRLLKDYEIDKVKRSLYENIKQTGSALDPQQYQNLGIAFKSRPDDNGYLGLVQVLFKIDENGPDNPQNQFQIVAANNKVNKKSYTPQQYEAIWKHPKFQKLIKDVLGINFVSDPDLRGAYIELTKSYEKAVVDMSDLLGEVLFNSIVNKVYTRKHKDTNTSSGLKTFISKQYDAEQVTYYEKGINISTGDIPVIPVNRRDILLGDLAMAKAINQNILSQAQSKTGEGTALANYTLSRMRNFYHNQLEMQCRKERSAVKDTEFVVNSSGLFEGILTRRELKTNKTNQQSTKFSDKQAFQLSFINDFMSAFVPNPDDLTYLKNGKVSFLPTVNSDKPQIDGLLVNLYAESPIKNADGTFKRYIELTNGEVEEVMALQFKPMYDRIMENISIELTKVAQLLENKGLLKVQIPLKASPILKNHALLRAINEAFKDDTRLGKKPKERITNGLHKLLTEYNKTHTRNPIMLSSQVHYVFGSDGLLTSNKVLDALWARFNTLDPGARRVNNLYLRQLYKNETEYLNFLQRNGLEDPTNSESFFKWQDHLTVKDLLGMKFQVYLRGTKDKVRHDQKEIQLLRGEAVFTNTQKTDPKYKHLVALNEEMKNWVSEDGYMIIAKGLVLDKKTNTYELTNITNIDQLNSAINLQLHPMLGKLNRLDYLCSQQYTVATVGSHYVHSGKPEAGKVLVEESRRWYASNKRNVAATSTVHLFQNKQLDGAPMQYNIAIMEDVREDLYTIMGDLYKEGHAPLDGGMIVNGFFPELENNSLAGEGAGTDKKHFGTFYSELYAAGGIIKTAGFAATNDRMRRQKAWRNLQRLMSSRPWVKEKADINGTDVREVVDITKDFLGRPIDYNRLIKNAQGKYQPVMYQKIAHDNPNQIAAYKLDHIESLGNNQYKIFEVEINAKGEPVGKVFERVEFYNDTEYDANGNIVNSGNLHTTAVTIDNNWDLYTKVFGGYTSLEIGADGKITPSENSRKFMAHAINNVGHRKNFSEIIEEATRTKSKEEVEELKKHLNSLETGLDQDDIWLPLKHSDIHFTPNIGAIKSLQFNVNPNGNEVLEGKTELNAFQIRLAQLGIQLDKEHHADASEVSMPTQIIQALANRSYTPYAKEAYKALATLTRQATQPFLDGIKDIITSNDPAKLTEEVTNLILEKLLNEKDDDNPVNSILSELMEKAAEGKEIKYVDDIKGKVAWSDPTITNRLFSVLSTTLTSTAVKMNFAGTLSVICPAGPMEQLYGDHTLDYFNQLYDKTTGSTRTTLPDLNLELYQQNVRDGNEIDSDGHNMLVFDLTRDQIQFPEQKPNESVDQYQERIRDIAKQKKLSQVSELKTQHNYVIEFEDGTVEKITINVPDDYYRVKNLVVNGKKRNLDPRLFKPFTYEEYLQQAEAETGIHDFLPEETQLSIIHNALSKPVLIQDSVVKELSRKGEFKTEIKNLFGLFLGKEKGGVTVKTLAKQIWEQYSHIFENDQQVRDLILDVIASARTTGDIKGYDAKLRRAHIKSIADEYYNRQEEEIYNMWQMTPEEYFDYYYEQTTSNSPVTKIYENIMDGRKLGAYNVRFTNKNTDPGVTQRFQMYDLDSVNLLFKLNYLNTKDNVTKEGTFQTLTPEKQQEILNLIFNNPMFFGERVYNNLKAEYPNIPNFDSNFMNALYQMYPVTLDNQGNQIYPTEIINIINKFVDITKPRAYRQMQQDLFKLSEHYSKPDRTVYVNGSKVDPIDIKVDAYELIMPKIYKTQFGLQEFDNLQEILRDEDFFIKRGIQRFKCKLNDSVYDYELKNFNGEHVYVLDKSKGIPEELKQQLISIEYDTIKNQLYRTDGHGKPVHKLSSKNDRIAEIGGVEVIITDNPLFYVQNFNYNTLKVSPARVTEESYKKLTDTLSVSKRTNAKNFIKAITVNESLFDLATFKLFNQKIEEITYDNIKADLTNKADFKSVAQLCRILLNNGRELHTSFKESLKLIAGRIPAQSQQSFMTQRVVAFDNSDINTAMVSTFQLFLQGSDLDIDAVTLLGYAFDKNGKFIGWSPYFDVRNEEMLEASKDMPLPTGETIEVTTSKKAPNNFFELYDKYFGTIFRTISLGMTPEGKPTGVKTKGNGAPLIQIHVETAEDMEDLAEFLRLANEYGINLKDDLVNGKFNPEDENFFKAPSVKLEDGTEVAREWNIFTSLGVDKDTARVYIYQIAKQLADFVNDHNAYLNNAEEHVKEAMAKNYVVHYIYKVSESPCNQTEAMQSVDVATRVLKGAAAKSRMAAEADYQAPGRTSAKVKSVGEGQAGKDGVGIGAVGIKANSTTQFYLSELIKYGSDSDKAKILFSPKTIGGVTYLGFSNMYTDQDWNDEEKRNFQQAWDYIQSLESEDQITNNVALDIAAMLSIAVDNAKDLALAKINSGPKLMGLYIYGMSLGVPVKTLCDIINSEEGLILKELTEGSIFNNDITAFKVLDVFDKLDGRIMGEISQFSMLSKTKGNKNVRIDTTIKVGDKMLKSIGSTQDILFAGMYEVYKTWYDANIGSKKHYAKNFSQMLEHLFSVPGSFDENGSTAFEYVYNQSIKDIDYLKAQIEKQSDPKTYINWNASFKQMTNYISDMSQKSRTFKLGKGSDLRTLAEGAEEMRILGSILGINKGLKPTFSEVETFIDNIENLIYNRKKIMGEEVSDDDKIDFHKFMSDETYQQEVIQKYEVVKHSVNIPHLLSKVPHFQGYLKTQMIPTSAFLANSVKYRTMHKYRKNVFSDFKGYGIEFEDTNIFKYFEVESKKDKESILRGLENLIHFKLFTRWAYDKKLQFRVPKGFKYFSKKVKLTDITENSDGLTVAQEDTLIPLWTTQGLASFKKYMEEYCIPLLINSPSFSKNEFVKNLIKFENEKTPIHSTVTSYTLPGDLMARSGRQAELNYTMFSDFKQLSTVKFQTNVPNGIPSIVDAFFIYSQYCFMGRKGQSSLMSAFDFISSKHDLRSSFTKHIAEMDVNGNISCSPEEIIIWCAPVGTQYSSSRWAYVTSQEEYGYQLKEKIVENFNYSSDDDSQQDQEAQEEQRAALQEARENGEYYPTFTKDNYGVYREEYLTSQYDRLTKNHFLTPSTSSKVAFDFTLPFKMDDVSYDINVSVKSDLITSITLTDGLRNAIAAKLQTQEDPKYTSVQEFERVLKNELDQIHIPYKVSLYTDSKRDIDFGILQNIINILLSC